MAAEARDAARGQCQARPAVARHGWREDTACANVAKTSIRFHGREVPVCWVHRRMWERWGENAEANAARYWYWPAT